MWCADADSAQATEIASALIGRVKKTAGPRTETAVFRKIFGPFANFWRPQTIFFGDDAADLHAHVTALVRDFDSACWNVFISANHADAALEAVMARSRSELTATENP